MTLKNYSLLKGHIAACLEEPDNASPHFQAQVDAQEESFRISVNVMSPAEPSGLMYKVVSDFQHAVTDKLLEMKEGLHNLVPKPYGAALDYIRGDLLDFTTMKKIPPGRPGPSNDLTDLLAMYTRRAQSQPNARVFVFGEKWEAEHTTRDRYFGFTPSQGIRNIHMNQGNTGHWAHDNGIYQDGGLIFHFPDDEQWVGIFLAFQAQSIHTDDKTGNPMKVQEMQEPCEVKIVAALVNPSGEEPGRETITLMNISDHTVSLSGWQVSDKNKSTLTLPPMHLPPDETIKIHLSGNDVKLSNKGGQITLLTPEGLKAHGVSYSRKQAALKGWSIVF